ncbi:hypothetical protein SAMN06298212_13627 [Ruaniaceae bacterium KH17]|nr:hypothetical protein SAMN06298212_13627 [Ruaniaceae bacterium KH17]
MAAIAVLLACAGCSTQADPPASTTGAVETPAPSADPSTEPDDDPATPVPTLPTDLPEPLADLVTEPVYPEAAREFTHDGAAAFIQYVIDAGNWAFATGDASPLMEHCDKESRYCANVADSASEFDPAVVRFGGLAEADVTEIEIFAEASKGFASGTISRASYVDIDASGTILREVESNEFDAVFELAFDQQWFLVGAGTP